MTDNLENNPWSHISRNNAHRVNRHGKYDFFWIKDAENRPGFVLQLSPDIVPIGHLPELKHIKCYYEKIEGRYWYFLILEDLAFQDMFETLCKDIIQVGEQAPDLETALSRTIVRTLRWYRLLSSGQNKMSESTQRGILGELAFLQELVDYVGPRKAIMAWKGPHGSPKDFELLNFFCEVKSRRSGAVMSVPISSEIQLSDTDDKNFILRIYNIDSSSDTEGKSFNDYINDVGKLLGEDDLQVIEMWESCLAELKYSPRDIDETTKWSIGQKSTYEVRDGFPRIIPPLPAGVQNVTYSLSLDQCEAFKCNDDLSHFLKKKE